MPDLEQMIAAWRAEMRAALPGREPVVEELEDHLRERTLALTRRGIRLPDAFAQAYAEIGPPSALAPQFRSLRRGRSRSRTAVRIVATIVIVPYLILMGIQFAAISGQLARERISPYSDAAPAAFFSNLLVCSLCALALGLIWRRRKKGESDLATPHGTTPTRTRMIKQKARALTMAAACCLVLSVPAALGLSSPHFAARVVSAAAVAIELMLILGAAFFWLREEPQQVDYELGQ